MLSEFVDRLVALGQKAKAVEFHRHEHLPNEVFVRHGDKLERITAPPMSRGHTLTGFHDLVTALGDSKIAPNPEVYIDGVSVFAYCDREKRWDDLDMPLTESARFKLCCELEKPRGFAPRDLVKFLRLELHGGAHQAVTQAVSRIDFMRTSSGKTDVKHGRETLGKSVEAVVQSAEDIPESFVVTVPIWSTPGCGWTKPIEFGIYLDNEKQQVELRAFSDECAQARNAALADLRNAIAEACPEVPVFMGSP